jgi:hypothetical protein
MPSTSRQGESPGLQAPAVAVDGDGDDDSDRDNATRGANFYIGRIQPEIGPGPSRGRSRRATILPSISLHNRPIWLLRSRSCYWL